MFVYVYIVCMYCVHVCFHGKLFSSDSLNLLFIFLGYGHTQRYSPSPPDAFSASYENFPASGPLCWGLKVWPRGGGVFSPFSRLRGEEDI